MAATPNTTRQARTARRCAHRQVPTLRTARTTILFVDVVDSTATAARLGDDAWCDLLDAFESGVRRAVRDHGGTLVKTLGDGALVRVDDPVAALAIARRVAQGAAALGLAVRAGAHLADVRRRADGDVAGLGVHVGARVADRADPGQLWCTEGTAQVLAAGGVVVEARGGHQLKGLEGSWALYGTPLDLP